MMEDEGFFRFEFHCFWPLIFLGREILAVFLSYPLFTISLVLVLFHACIGGTELCHHSHLATFQSKYSHGLAFQF